MIYLKSVLMPVAIVAAVSTFAQKSQPKFKFGDVTAQDFEPSVYPVDSSASAVYLYDIGSSNFEGNTKGWFNVIYTRHARIRILNKNAFDAATISIPLYTDGINTDKLSDLEAATYNVEDGKVVATTVDKNSLFKDKSENEIVEKFTFPNIKEGSIIEYSYKVSSLIFNYIEPWYFQGNYPRIWTQYSVEIPQIFDFITLKQGYVPCVVDSAKASTDNFNLYLPGETANERGETLSFRSTTFYHIWAMQNVPALKEEEYTTTLRNHVSKIEFQLSSIRIPNQPIRPIMQNWYTVADELMKDDDFGAPLTHGNNWLDDDIKKMTQSAENDEQKARRIFAFVRDNFSCTDYNARYLSTTIKKTYQARKGNEADINILLGAMLQNAGFEVHPVMLSTREHGLTYDAYPIMSKFNYVVMQAIKNDQVYLLDASDPSNAFNQLPGECYNGYARIIASQPVLIDLSPDSLKDSKTTTVFIINDENALSGSYSSKLGRLESWETRKQLTQEKEEDFFKGIKKAYPTDFELSNTGIDSIKAPEEPLNIRYDVKLNLNNEDLIYFNPMLVEGYKENPFKAAERFYPVEMPACFDETYILNMEIPKGYTVEEMPKSARITLNGEEGMFEYMIASGNGRIQLRCRTKLNKASFEPDDYQTLRDFFAFIVKKQAEQIVFKKQS